MKKPGMKLVAGLIAAMIVGTIGAVLVSAEAYDDDETNEWHVPFDRKNIGVLRAIPSELTDDEQAELDALVTSLNEEGASCEEIREAVFAKLNDMGILDEQLDIAIEQTEQRLEILNRGNELRDQGYSWEEINEILQEEFVLGHATNVYHGIDQESIWSYTGPDEEEYNMETSSL